MNTKILVILIICANLYFVNYRSSQAQNINNNINSSTSIEQLELKVDNLESKINLSNTHFNTEKQKCYNKFLLNYCLDKFQQEEYKINDNINQEIIIIKSQIRTIKFNQGEERRANANILQKNNYNQTINEAKNTKNIEATIVDLPKNSTPPLKLVTSSTVPKKIAFNTIHNNIVKKRINKNISKLNKIQPNINKADIEISNQYDNQQYQQKLKELEQRKQSLERRIQKIDSYLKKN